MIKHKDGIIQASMSCYCSLCEVSRVRSHHFKEFITKHQKLFIILLCGVRTQTEVVLKDEPSIL